MNKTALRTVALILCVVLSLSLTACGTANGPAPGQTSSTAKPEGDAASAQTAGSESGYAWKAEFVNVSLPANASSYLAPAVYTDDGFYAVGTENVGRRTVPEDQQEQYEGQYDLTASVLYFVDRTGKATRLENFEPSLPAEDTEGRRDYFSYRNLALPVLNRDGNLTALEQQYISWYEGPDSAFGTEQQYEYYSYEQSYDIVVFSPDGAELSRATVELDREGDVWLNTSGTVCDGDGNLLATMDTMLLAIAPDGSIAWSVVSDDYINSIVRLPDGGVAVMCYGDNGPELRPVDPEKKDFGEPIALPDNVWSITPGDGDWDFYYTSGLYLYGFRLGDEDSTQLLNWMSCDINGDSVDASSMHFYPDGHVMGMTYDYSADDFVSQVFTLTKVPVDSLPAKRILTVAQLAYTPDYQLTGKIVRFNRAHDDVRIEYKDYTQYNTEDDMSAGLTKFMTEVMAGNLPDIIPMNSLPYQQLAAKGLLEDLYPYIDADEALTREDFFANVLSALEVDGGLYQIAPSFSVQTLMGASSIVGNTPGWTYDEFYEALAKMPEGCSPMDPYVTRDQVLSALLYSNMDSFVDWTTGKVNFEGEEFRQLVEFAKTFPESYDWENHAYNESTNELLQQGKQMLAQVYLYSLDSVLWNNITFGGSATYIGWPTCSGVGSIMLTDGGYAISRSSPNKDIAWEFLHSMLTEEGQTGFWSIPINRKVFDAKLNDLMEIQYRKDGSGNYVLDENGERIQVPRGAWTDESGTEHTVYAMTREQANSLLEAIESCTRMANYDTSISDIVSEQLQAYFLNQKSLDDVCRLIQSKANIYVNEQR